MVAYRYADHSVYYTLSGTKIGSYPGAEGFFEDGLLLCRDASTGLYSFVKQDGTAAFPASFAAAGAFSDGLALVRSADSALVGWWKNNSFTPEAIKADGYLEQLREKK